MSIDKRAQSPAKSHDNRLSKRARTTSKNAKKGKRRERRDRVDDEGGSDSDSLAESERDTESDVECGIPIKDIKGAGRTIARCCDMFCDVNKAVHLVMLSKQEDQGESDSEDEDRHQTRKEALERIGPQVLARYQKVYFTLIHEIPSIKMLIQDPSRAPALKTMLKKINEAINETRSSDSARLREKLPSYILQNPKVDTMKPPINSSTTKSELGLNHPQLAGYLCPVESASAFNENPEETRKKLEGGKIDMSATELPAFLWEDNGTKFDEEDIYLGLFRGFYLERVARHIFTGPSTAHGGDSRGVRSCNAVLHRMEKVEAAHIAYAAVLARFAISSQSRWSEKDGCFNYRKFYYITMDLINECEDIEWKEGLLKYFNVLFFGNEEGRSAGFTAKDDDSAPLSTSKNGGFLSRMRAQAAARATHSTVKSSSVITNDSFPETSPASSQARVPEVDDSLDRQLPQQSPQQHVSRVPEVDDSSERQLPPQPSPQQHASRYVSPPYTQVPATITPVNTTTLEPFSDLSEIEPDEESGKRKSLVSKGKRKATGRSSQAGPSKRRSGRKKAGNNT